MASKKARGVNAKTRNLKRGKGSKVSVNKLLLEIPAGAHVQVNIDSSIHSGMPHRRFQGKTGVVTGKRGRAYLMEVLQGNQSCKLIVNSAHLRVIRPVEASKAVKAEAMA
ncbi:MAG TPA: 50S ribosomal protein L21e [Candidatus Diapherotrites archaeon]|uniref:Large ribosomal subunit protein eL21 n=1 Tax=Candidatus Iainarchaeum sp. TaxID=3101447 RepID=A0A7J4JGC5_9ARCH|nr:50S ribosomal protein L21e [Candidatus Diapherotrites archaeon]HIH16813.1 50S ribosomal protein L21e [Candidatus Diapherotrites archaeon]